MTAATAGRDTKEVGFVQEVAALAFPVAAATSIFAGTMVGTDSAGNAVPATATTAIKLWGRAESTQLNTVAAGFGTAGQKTIEVQPGVFMFNNGDGITAADAGKPCYAGDDNTVFLASSVLGVAKPYAGIIYGLTGSEVRVGIGPLFGAPFASGAAAGGVATLAAFAANAIAPAVTAIQDGAVYDVPATAAASTITLPATAPVGTRLTFCADGTKNGHTVQFLDGNGAAALTAALVASKRFCVIAVKTTATAWTATGNSSP